LGKRFPGRTSDSGAGSNTRSSVSAARAYRQALARRRTRQQRKPYDVFGTGTGAPLGVAAAVGNRSRPIHDFRSLRVYERSGGGSQIVAGQVTPVEGGRRWPPPPRTA
jgi:hypothetical protein